MKLKKLVKYSTIVTIVLLTSLIVVSLLIVYMSSRMTEKHTNQISGMFINDMNYDLISFVNDSLNHSVEMEITSRYGHKIPITYFKNDDNFNKKTVVLVHWHETNRLAMYPLTELFFKDGYNVVLYDQRAHGGNTAKTVTFGLYEKDDLEDVINYIENQASEDIEIGLLGQSMGASTVGYYLGTQHSREHVKFAIMESPFSSMYQEIKWNIESIIRNKFISSSLTRLGSRANELIYGFRFEDVSILESMKNNSIPTLIMHSKSDSVCAFSMGEELFAMIPHTNKKFIIFDNTQHIQAFFQEREKYVSELTSFIKTYSK